MNKQVFDDKCPVCGFEEWNYDGFAELDGQDKTNICTCDDCGAKWKEVYTFKENIILTADED